jgi:hypothetical protein
MRHSQGASHATVAGHALPVGYDWSNSQFPIARESDGTIAGMAFATPLFGDKAVLSAAAVL